MLIKELKSVINDLNPWWWGRIPEENNWPRRHILKQGFLTLILFNFTRSVRKGARQLKKGYVTSPNFTAVMGGYTKDTVPPDLLGHLVETQAATVLSYRFQEISFWKKRKKEIDFCTIAPPNCYWIESKFKSRVDKNAWIHLLNPPTTKRLKNIHRIVLTANTIQQIDLPPGQTIKLLPIWAI